MPVKEFVRFEDSGIYIDGCEFKGIENFSVEYDDLDSKEIPGNLEFVKKVNDQTLTVEYKINRIVFLQFIGIWKYALKYCPNRRVVHLMQFGKNDKIKIKNFYRAVNIIAEVIC